MGPFVKLLIFGSYLEGTVPIRLFRIMSILITFRLLSASWKENDLSWYISVIRQTVRYRTPVFTQPFSCPLHITINTYNLPHMETLNKFLCMRIYGTLCKVVDFWQLLGRNSTNTVVSNHVNSDHVPSFSCLDVWNVRQTTSGVRYYCDNVKIS
jgi:hypothetical protein